MSTTKSVIRTIKNVANGYSSVQVMVRNATSNDPTGPTTAQMADVANHTYEPGEFLEVMDMVDRRLNDKGKNWRHIAKSLTLLDYLVRYGSDDVVIWAKDNLYVIKTLREFQTTDSTGADQGAVIRVKAKELTSLLKDDERLKQERDLARQRLAERRSRRNRRRPDSPPDPDEYDEALQKALEQSRLTAEEEERRRHNQSDDSLEKAIQLSLEEDELRKRNANLLDIDDNDQAPQVFGYYPQGQGQIIGYDMFGNPVYANQAMNTGYLQNAYQDMAALEQQQAYQQQLALQQQQQQQQQLYQQQQAAMEQQLYQQQQAALLQQQQQAALLQQQQQQQQQQIPLKTGSNNPFAFGQQANGKQSQQPQPQPQQQQPQQQQQQQQPMKQTPTGSQKFNDQYSQLNALLATGTGVDTFGNVGETRIPAQHTKTGTFINSYGTGYKQETGSANPFFDTQYTGIPSTAITPAYTGYGFGNQPSQGNGERKSQQGGSLIDL